MSPVFDVPPTMPREWVRCRGSRVHWLDSIPVPADALRSSRRGAVVVWWRCMNCGTERHDELDAVTLEVVSRRYVYPDGYLMDRDDAPTPATWRATYLTALGVLSKRQITENRRYRRETWEAETDGSTT